MATGTPERRNPLRGHGRLVAGVVVGGLVTAFALLNLDEVQVNWLFGTWSTPLIIVIALSFFCGSFAGWAFARYRRR